MKRACRIGAIGMVLAGAIAVSPARAVECTQQDADAAEKSVDHLGSWKEIYSSYERFKQCDDGGIAEGYSDGVAKIMAKHWASLPKVLPFIQADPAFETWFIRHLDQTDDNDDLVKIDRRARTACPKHAEALCAKIHQQMLSYNCPEEFPASVSCEAQRDITGTR